MKRFYYMTLLGIVISRMCVASVPTDSLQAFFSYMFSYNGWRDQESYSGSGSNLTQTAVIRYAIAEIVEKLDINIFLDAPCGDFYWMKEVNLPVQQYIGVDIVPELIARNKKLYEGNGRTFICLNIVSEQLPYADLIMCRDCLVHLQFHDAIAAVKNFKGSGARYLLATTFTRQEPNKDTAKIGTWRPLNLQLEPFNFPAPLVLINEHCTEKDGAYADKCLGLWVLDDIII